MRWSSTTAPAGSTRTPWSPGWPPAACGRGGAATWSACSCGCHPWSPTPCWATALDWAAWWPAWTTCGDRRPPRPARSCTPPRPGASGARSPAAARAREQLHAARSWDERFAIAAATLGQRLEAGRAADPQVAFAWRRMAANQGRIRVERLAAETGWSRKRLWSRFRSQLGLTPKRPAQLVRFDHAAHRLAAGHSPAEVAADSGYADQSHLHREAMALSGLTPTAGAAAPWLAVAPVAWPRR